MTEQELLDAFEGREAYQVVSDLGDRFVTSTLTSSAEFWRGDDTRRELYSLLAVLHHANANGLKAIIDYNEELWVPVIAYASKMISEFQIIYLETAIMQFEELLAANLKLFPQKKLPRSAAHLRDLQEFSTSQEFEWDDVLDDELSQSGVVFVGCAESELPGKVAEWMKINAQRIAPLL